MDDFYINIFSIANSTAPGIPSIPTTSAVITFIPIWNCHNAPTKLIMYKSTTPNIEVIINLPIIFIGTINTFPTIIIPIMQATYISNIFTSILEIPP